MWENNFRSAVVLAPVLDLKVPIVKTGPEKQVDVNFQAGTIPCAVLDKTGNSVVVESPDGACPV